EEGGSLFAAARREGLAYKQTIVQLVQSAAVRQGLQSPTAARRKGADRLRVGFTFNIKRIDSKQGDDAEAEYDPPETISAIRLALESLGHEVISLEANNELPQRLAESRVDVVFNIAEGFSGRNRE